LLIQQAIIRLDTNIFFTFLESSTSTENATTQGEFTLLENERFKIMNN